MLQRYRVMIAITGVVMLLSGAAFGKTLTWANDGDVNSLDPYTREEAFQFGFNFNIYEGLTRLSPELQVEPALATEWKMVSPTLWRFSLRRGVKFQDGSPLTADDVLFSFQRARAEGSAIISVLGVVKDVRRVDEATIEIETNYAYPVLPGYLAYWAIMSRSWCEQHKAVKPANLATVEENFATRHAMGTGPFQLSSRDPNVKTVLVPNPLWWDKPVHNLTEIVFLPIANAATRVAALKSGEIDMIYTVPPQDIAPLAKTPGIKILEIPELRQIYFAFDQVRDELLWSNVKGRNPFKDLRVRKAFWMAIDNEAITQRVMRGHSYPDALMWPPGLEGYDKSIDIRPHYDPVAAKALLSEAGYPDGFSVTLDCSNDRYVNDEAICQAVVGMLAKIGVKVDLRAQTKLRFFEQVLGPHYNTSFLMIGWGAYVPQDGLYTLATAVHSRRGDDFGDNNDGGYANATVDQLIEQALVEVDLSKRHDLMRQAAILHRDDVGHIPLHAQSMVWAVRSNVDAVIQATGGFQFRLFRVN